jgi:spore maturation protein CgeB
MLKEIEKILIVGVTLDFSLEQSYARAATFMGKTVKMFNPIIVSEKYSKLGYIGKQFQRFLPLESWDRKVNRDLVVTVKEFEPDVIMVFTNSRILYGALITIKTISKAQLVWIWPDSPLNLNDNNYFSRKLFDLSATYSIGSLQYFQQVGFNNVHWVPLAGDSMMHLIKKEKSDLIRDISFVGMWRPERERYMKSIIENLGHLNIEIYGTVWKQRSNDKVVLKKWKGNGITGKDMAQYFSGSRVNINVIDDTNFPAANMRFFEICMAGGLQVTTLAPEMESKFLHKKHILYSKNETEMLENIDWVLKNPDKADLIRKEGQQLVENSELYIHRFQYILDELSKLVN